MPIGRVPRRASGDVTCARSARRQYGRRTVSDVASCRELAGGFLDDDGNAIAIVEITRAETHRFDDVPWEFADAGGEDFRSIEHWRDGHASYYARRGIEIGKETLVVCVWFRLFDPTQ